MDKDTDTQGKHHMTMQVEAVMSLQAEEGMSRITGNHQKLGEAAEPVEEVSPADMLISGL